jgi:hypothetical protein
MKKTVNLVSAYHFDVFCGMNDYADIKCGGPPTLGYDFYVDGENTKNQKKFKKIIEDLLKKYNRHYQSISVRIIKEFREDQLWSEEDIERCIKNHNPND